MSNLPPLPEPMAALLWEHLQFDVRNRTDAQLEAFCAALRSYAEEAVRLERERQEAIRHAGAMLSRRQNGRQMKPQTIEAWKGALRLVLVLIVSSVLVYLVNRYMHWY